jgi:hypothetical protein
MPDALFPLLDVSLEAENHRDAENGIYQWQRPIASNNSRNNEEFGSFHFQMAQVGQ